MVIILLTVLLSSVVCVLIVPGVCAVKLSATDMGLGVLRDFFGLDLKKYDVLVEENSFSEPFLGGVTFESALFTLTSEDSELRIVFTFAEGNLRNMYVFEDRGVSLLKTSVGDNVVGDAQVFLRSYEQYVARPFFGELKISLDDVANNKNYTKTIGNNTLEVIVYDNKETSFKWHYTARDTLLSHNSVVTLGFKNGALVSFTDMGDLYRGDKSFEPLNDVLNTEIKTGLTGQSFENSAAFDGTRYFMTIFITGLGSVLVTCLISKNKSNLQPLKRFSKKTVGFILILVVLLPLISSANALPAGVIWGSRSSGAANSLYGQHSWRKTDSEISRQEYVSNFISSKCLTAANGYVGFSSLWSNKSSILSQAQSLSDKYNHVAVFDWDHGVGGYPGTVSSYAMPEDEIHYMFEDDFGTFVGAPAAYKVEGNHGVYDVDIYEVFPAGKVHFAFINTCLSANTELFGQGTSASGYPLGLPYAFTHRIVSYVPEGSNSTLMSNDGYNRPDAFPQCYIGFPFGSAALDQEMPYHNQGQPWYEWITLFCYIAFNFDVSVNEALDWTCNIQWGCPSFGNSPLQGEGFTAIWPVWDHTYKTFDENVSRAQGPHSTLAVYGNGNIHLKNFQAEHMTTYPYVNAQKTGDVNAQIGFSAYSVDSLGHDIQYIFDWGDDTPQTTTDYTTAGVPVNVSHSWNAGGTYKITVRAQCKDDPWTDVSETYTIKIGNHYRLIVPIAGLTIGSIILLMVLQHRSLKTLIKTNKTKH
jgi:hypothetical protein